MPEQERTYICCDMKSFYASVECVARKLDPLKANLLVADESRTDKTICLAVSPALKAIGVPSRPRLFEAKERIRQFEAISHTKVEYIIAPPRMGEYIRVSSKIYEIFRKYVADCDAHVYSIDELFIDVTPYLHLYQAKADAAGVSPAHYFAITMIRDTAEYLRVFSLGAPFMIASGAVGNVLRADGGSKETVLASMLGTCLNIILDPLMISGLHMGVLGAALATDIGNIVSFIAVLGAAKKKSIALGIRHFTLRKDVSLQVLSLGLTMAASTLLMSFSHTFANRLFVSYGADAVAAQSVAGKASMLVCMLVMGLCMGVQPVVSYAYGQKNQRRLRQIVLGTAFAAVIIGAVLSALFVLVRRQFVGMFLNTPAVIEIGEKMVVAGLATAAISGIYQMCQVYLQGTGKVSFATFTALLQKGIVYLPVLYLMHALGGLNGLIWSGAVTDVIATAVGVLLCLVWNRQMKQAESNPYAVSSIRPA